MNIAVIYHSVTGNTEKLARALAARLTRAGHAVTPVKLETDGPIKTGNFRQAMKFKVTNLPDLSGFEALCLGGPVWGFGPSPVTYQAIGQMPDLGGRKVLPFVTMGFPLKGMGGRGSLKHLRQALEKKNATVLPGIIVPRLFHNLEKEIEAGLQGCEQYFQA